MHQAYLPVVAASTRASILHYCCNDREFAWGPLNDHHHNTNGLTHGPSKEFIPQVLLIDAGCEWDCYASDITRTMPVGNGGKFTPEARAIYELVLEMQKVNEDCCFFFLCLVDVFRFESFSFYLHSNRSTSSNPVFIGTLYSLSVIVLS